MLLRSCSNLDIGVWFFVFRFRSLFPYPPAILTFLIRYLFWITFRFRISSRSLPGICFVYSSVGYFNSVNAGFWFVGFFSNRCVLILGYIRYHPSVFVSWSASTSEVALSPAIIACLFQCGTFECWVPVRCIAEFTRSIVIEFIFRFCHNLIQSLHQFVFYLFFLIGYQCFRYFRYCVLVVLFVSVLFYDFDRFFLNLVFFFFIVVCLGVFCP